MSSEKLDEYALAPPYLHMLTEVQRKVHNSDSMLGRLDRLEAMFHSECLVQGVFRDFRVWGF